MAAEIVVAGIAAVAAVASAWLANRGRVHARAALHEVKNDHTQNLRVEQDDRYFEQGSKLDKIIATQETFRHQQNAQGREIRALRNDLSRESDRIWELEKTSDREGVKHARENQTD